MLLEPLSNTQWKALIRNQAALKDPQQKLFFINEVKNYVLSPEPGVIDFSPCCDNKAEIFALLDKWGEMPLPPYIKDKNPLRDKNRYQSIWAKDEHLGSAAAPTASLHFDEQTLTSMQAQGIEFIDGVLQVGLGTFAPIRNPDLNQHQMHAEHFSLSQDSLKKLSAAHKQQSICCVGTTAMRLLESINLDSPKRQLPHTDLNFDAQGNLSGTTSIFIKNNFTIQNTDVLFTNFHLPKSSLLVLLSTFAGSTRFVLESYREAIKRRYRFFSYGDASIWL